MGTKFILIIGAELSRGNHPEAEVVFPEDGLHPSKRWAVVRARVAQILRDGHAGPIRIVTHDQGVVATFGQRIADGLSSVDDVQVQLHRADKVDSLRFRPDGSIEDWSIGFFMRDPMDVLLDGEETPVYVWADEAATTTATKG